MKDFILWFICWYSDSARLVKYEGNMTDITILLIFFIWFESLAKYVRFQNETIFLRKSKIFAIHLRPELSDGHLWKSNQQITYQGSALQCVLVFQ